MEYLLAKIKGKSGSFKIILSADTILHMPHDINGVAYNSTYKLDENEWFTIDNISQKDYFCESAFYTEVADKPFSSGDYNQITENEYTDIDYFCIATEPHGKLFSFQRKYPTQIIKKRWFDISGAPHLNVDKPIIILNTFIDCIYRKSDDSIVFKDIHKIKTIFPGIETLFREATQEEVDKFCRMEFIRLDASFTSNDIKIQNRKRIAWALEILEEFNNEEIEAISEYIKDYNGEMKFSDGKFIVSSEEDLKNLIYGIDQRYYTTFIGDNKRLANSVRSL